MASERQGILDVLKRDPDQAKLMLKFAFLGPVVIVAWEYGAPHVLPALGVLLIQLLLILIYAGGITHFIARIVQSANRWEISAGQSAEKLRLGNRRGELSSLPQPILHTGYHDAYFMFRFQDEVRTARRQGHHLSVAALEVTLPDEKLSPAVVERVNHELAKMIAGQAQTISLSLSASETEVVFSMPHLDGPQARAFVSKIVQAFGSYWCHYGIVSYPQDFTDAEKLFIGARQACDASRRDSSPAPQRQTAVAS